MRLPSPLATGLAALSIAVFGAFASADSPDISYTVQRVSERVIVINCMNVNVIAIAARSGMVIVDTNRSPAVMQRLRQVIEAEFGRRDFAYVVNTHGDPDHCSGNAAFPSIPLVAHEDYAAYVTHSRASTLLSRWRRTTRLEEARNRYRTLNPGSEEAKGLLAEISTLELMDSGFPDGQAPQAPAVAFRDSLNLNLGDLTLELRFCGDAHTNHDIVVYVPEERLLLVGDLICSPQSPCFSIDAMADVPRLVGELNGLLRRRSGLETVVPGHGKTLSGDELHGWCQAIAERYETVDRSMSAAWVLSQAIERDGIQAALQRCPPPGRDDQTRLDWSESEFNKLGIRLIRRGLIDEAASVLQLGIAALPESALLHDCLGDAYVEKDDLDAAKGAYQRSLTLLREDRYAKDMLRGLSGP